MRPQSRHRIKAKAALRGRFSGNTDDLGYVDWPKNNLVPGVHIDQFESDLRHGDGNELRIKFCAVHSSSALVVNCFARFKDRHEDLVLFGLRGSARIEFEKKLPIIPRRRPSNLDVWIDRGETAVAVESKLLEYFEPKRPEFADAYKCMEAKSEPCWWKMYEHARVGSPQHLDCAQLVKHYFGLVQIEPPRPSLTLLYLFWEPENWREVEECTRHREEVEEFADKVTTSSIQFRWMTYTQLWREWMEIPNLREHATNLKARYEVSI
jgi:Restriction Endonuclease associating with ARP